MAKISSCGSLKVAKKVVATLNKMGVSDETAKNTWVEVWDGCREQGLVIKSTGSEGGRLVHQRLGAFTQGGNPAELAHILAAAGGEGARLQLGFQLFGGQLERAGETVNLKVFKPHGLGPLVG